MSGRSVADIVADLRWQSGMAWNPLCTEAADLLERIDAENKRLRTAIEDIDAHATPMGVARADDPDGNPYYYYLTVGALHRALGVIGHSAAPCECRDRQAEMELGRWLAASQNQCLFYLNRLTELGVDVEELERQRP